MNSPEVKAFIHKHSVLFWYTPEDRKENISLDFLVEHILNYGSSEAIRELFSIIGVDEAALIFFRNTAHDERKRGNYFDLVYNYFNLYFKRHACRNPFERAV
jgi:hypothetical protein